MKIEILLLVVLITIGLITAFSTYSSNKRRTSFDKGNDGEQLIRKHLAHYEKIGAKFLSNIYVPKANGGTAEIDLVLIHPKGLFVFESKNYSGWIFGNERHQNWTQTFPKNWNGKGHKQRFYNPILQNSNHIKHLKHHMEKSIPVWSIIVFSDECELKDITVSSNNVRVVQCRQVASCVRQICDALSFDLFTAVEIEELQNHFSKFSDVSKIDKKIHSQKAFKASHRFKDTPSN